MLELVRRQSQTRRRALRTTTATASGLYPAVGAPSSDPRGVIIGREIYSGKAYIYDPFILYDPSARERLPSGHALVLGKSGFGKSSLEKCYVLRQLRFSNRSFCILDAQGEDGVGEWDSIARALDVTPIRLVYGGEDGEGVRLNPLDPRIPSQHQFKILCSMVEIIGGPLTSETEFSLSVAHATAQAQAEAAGRVAVLSDIHDALTNPEPAMLGRRQVSVEDMLAWGQPASLAMDQLCSPTRDLAGLFNGPTTDGIDLDARLIVFDLTRLPREGEAMPLLMSVIGPWLRYAWISPGDGIKRTLIVEEAWHILSHRPVARLFEEFVRYGRRLGLSFWAILHHLGDLMVDEAPEAAAILKLTATRVLYHMDKAEADITADYLQLPDWAREALVDGASRCSPGRAVWQVGNRMHLVEHIRSATESELTNTNRAMAEASTGGQAPAAPLISMRKSAA
ncbi:ATP/GTP-binding protein (plasmid) [Streptomyces sp. NBC_01281]|uniref:ATP/GTP-binding protein n=1 Tax=Streptomyces sp. NBC_01281 TaxID=2903811 RepID=UPI002E0F5046|nr:ATP/GTP-binding protein [Streptomyces sp. NBC_01281]